MTRKGTSGGKAEATGSDYETRVAAWYCARVLLGGAVQPLFDLPADVRLVSASCQTDAPVDDVNVKTSDDGNIFVQAKRTVYLSDAGNSALVKLTDRNSTIITEHRQWGACHARQAGAELLRMRSGGDKQARPKNRPAILGSDYRYDLVKAFLGVFFPRELI